MEESQFVKVCTIKSNDRINVSLYRSKLSGMRVAFAEQYGPTVNAQFSFATKASSDDGLPHTLEHLIFQGSQSYPYNGFLDIVSNQCFGSRINGSTDEDMTDYTIDTLGEENLLKILPVYLDHLFFPQLTPEQYATEIHHINEEGRDGGVVYAEMQGRENDMSEIMNFSLRRVAFPEGHPFQVNTGGTLSALRDICSLERVKAYHKEFYQPSNMMLVIVGLVDANKVIDILSIFENKFEQIPIKNRPFDDVELPEYFPFKIEHIQYPAEDESVGNVFVSWQGPLFSDPDALSLPYLLSHFCSGAESPLQQRFTQLSDPICDNVTSRYSKRSRNQFKFSFWGVKQKFLNDEELFTTVLLQVLKESKIDMNRLKASINQLIQRNQIQLEEDFSSYYMYVFSTYLLYASGVSFDSDNVPYLQLCLNQNDYLKSLLEYDEDYWKNLAEKYFTNDRIVLIGHPNAGLIDEISQTEKDRLAIQIERLGAEGLQKCGDSLKAAIEKNQAAVSPKDILENFVVDEINTKLIDVERTLIDSNSVSHYPIICHKLDSKFLSIVVMFDLHEIPEKHRSLLDLYTSLIFTSNAEIDGKIVSYEDIPTMLKQDFISYNTFSCFYNEFLCFSFTLLPEKYSKVEKWMQIWLKNLIFDNSRIGLLAKNFSSSSTQLKQNGNAIAGELSSYLVTSKNSNVISSSLLTFGKFHQEIADYASDNNGAMIIDALNELSEIIIHSPANVHLKGNEDALTLATTIKWNFSNQIQPTTTFFKGDWKYSLDFSQNQGRTVIIPYGTNESAFLRQFCEANFQYMSPQIVYVQLLCQYLNQADGPIYTNVRGKGLAYGAYISVYEKCAIKLELNRAADLLKAYEELKRVITEIINSRSLDENLFKAAKRSMISDLIQCVGFPSYAGNVSLSGFLRDIPSTEIAIKYHMDQVRQTTPEKLFDAVSQNFLDLFDETKCIRAVVPYQNDLENFQKYFKGAQTMSTDDFHYENTLF